MAIFRYLPAEKAIDGKSVKVICNEVIDTEKLKDLSLGRGEFFERLRVQGCRKLASPRRNKPGRVRPGYSTNKLDADHFRFCTT